MTEETDMECESDITKTSTACTSSSLDDTKKIEGKIAGPDPPLYYNSSWRLISQGAEARVWYVPSFVSVDDDGTTDAVCKERFAKAYRHVDLDVSISKSRTKAEVRSMVKCRRGGVLTPAIYGVLMPSSSSAKTNSTSRSSCIFMEYIDGCTVRQFLDQRMSTLQNNNNNNNNNEDETTPTNGGEDSSEEEEDQAETKKPRLLPEEEPTTTSLASIDQPSMLVSKEIGLFVAKMHNLNIVHGDLTTSNILLKNNNNKSPSYDNNWKPELVMIDFGLASNSTGSGKKGGGVSGHEDKAVDLYVLERAFKATHPGSDHLVKEVLRAYKGACSMSDSVLQRLAQVRLRGRKREAFG